MAKCSLNKNTRQRQLSRYLEEDPFLTDEDLASILKVSVQTIRLDRFDLQIPELRERVKNVARGGRQLRTMSGGELVGDLVDLEIGNSGMSILPVTPAMTLSKTSVARGHHIFAQANSLAVAVIDAGAALTGAARVSYKRPVYCGEKILAKAVIKIKKGNKYMVKVTSEVKDEIVFKGKFLVFALQEEGVPQ
ncbi:Transcription factor FapR [Pelotomaculum schinkii]|uniref:Transcription factor FapR n=1 Tax=Pelotomaculum schinkii TaxID=78350 RepID=A0A4Y7RA37_9FIRM|nr:MULTISPECIES: transcription factor FapR [Pelotomaculum]TEB05521.1 Transcription factor FapR [Pelotomaculum schinkii]TEB14522.1 Transcription factor FapR [Pelotomaculum sp. FP]